MAAPTASLDKASYNPGDVATLTVTRDRGHLDGTITVDGQMLQVHADLTKPIIVTSSYSFTLVSDDGSTAVYTTTV